MTSRRLEDRIRALCSRALYESGRDWEITLHELQLASHQHALRLGNMTTAATVGGKPDVFIERRDINPSIRFRQRS